MCQEICVAGQQKVGSSCVRQLEELVVARVATERQALGDLHKVDYARKLIEERNTLGPCYLCRQFGTTQHRVQLLERLMRGQNHASSAARSQARRGFDCESMRALTRTLVSTTNRGLTLIQDPGELLLREPASLRAPADHIHDGFERSGGGKLVILRLDQDRYPLIEPEPALLTPRLG